MKTEFIEKLNEVINYSFYEEQRHFEESIEFSQNELNKNKKRK